VVGGSNPLIPTKHSPEALDCGLGFLFLWQVSAALLDDSMDQRLILVTNDDGVSAPGLQALAEALAALGQVCVVAPDREVSACGQSLTLTRPVDAQAIGRDVYSVNGTPADCVNLALLRVLRRRPDLVVSGINRGANLGDDVYYSGTVGGAREGTFFGIPALAVSLATRSEGDFAVAADFGARLARLVFERGLPARTLLNVNVPAGRPSRAVVTVQGHRRPDRDDGDGSDARRSSGDWPELSAGDDGSALSDIEAVKQGWISVTPLHTDSTFHAAVPVFRTWEQWLRNGHLS
jgi:5'-nucleotidase